MKKLFLFLCMSVCLNSQLIAQNTSYDSAAVPIGGVNNVAIGIGVLKVNAGLRNVGVGIGAMENLGVASDNTAIGYHAMNLSVGTSYNTAVGKEALRNSQGPYNTALGWGAMVSNVSGEGNTATGGLSLGANVSGIFNTANGYLSLYNNTNGSGNTGVGVQSLYANTIGNNNTAVGRNALYNNTGSYNTAQGYESLLNNTTGEGNTGSGMWSLKNNTTGTWNTANGLSSLYYNTTGSSNTAFGLQALVNNTTGNNNTATGKDALANNITGSNNSVFGYGADVLNDGLTNSTAIGYNSKVTESNAIQLGNASVAKVFNGVGNNATFITGGLQVTGGSPGIGKVLTSDANGIATWQTPAGGGGPGWLLIGNAGTVDGTNFIGTTDNVPLTLRVNNLQSGRIEANNLTANTFYGYRSGLANTSGVNNAGMGWQALQSNTSGIFNTANGYQSLSLNTTGNYNTANGAITLFLNSTGNNNTTTGHQSSFFNTTGNDNTADGYQALYNNSTGNRNIAIGRRALYNNTTGSNNTAIGDSSGVATPNLSNTTAVGYQAVTTQSNSIQLGNNAVTTIFAGVGNTTTIVSGGLLVTNNLRFSGGSPGVGKVLTSDATGVASWQALPAAGASWSLTGNSVSNQGTNFLGTTNAMPLNFRVNNQKAGSIELNANSANTFYGYLSGNLNSSGGYNTAIGYSTLASSTGSSGNTATGAFALSANANSGNYNSAFGTQALTANIGGSLNTATGNSALINNTGGNRNTATGVEALRENIGGNRNTAIGVASMLNNRSGNFNTAVGVSSLTGNIAGDYNTALGFNAGVGGNNFTNATAIGYNAMATSGNRVTLGNLAVLTVEGAVPYTLISDGRFKNNISESDVKGLAFINKLRPVVYNLDSKKLQKHITQNMPDSVTKIYLDQNFGPSAAVRQSGFIAQEVEKAAKETGYNFNGVHKPENENDHYSLAYSQFVVPLVKAVQEQQQMIEDLQNQLKQLKLVQQGNLTESSPTSVTSVVLADINAVVLSQNVPNPFAQQTSISYTIPLTATSAQIMFYTMDGRLMKTVNLSAKGKGVLNIFAGDLSSGNYTYSLVIDGKITDTKKLVKQ